jgi:hypothetical protein
MSIKKIGGNLPPGTVVRGKRPSVSCGSCGKTGLMGRQNAKGETVVSCPCGAVTILRKM